MSGAEEKRTQPAGPEISIVQSGVPCGLFQKRTEPGYLLVDGTVLLESERDPFGRYRGGAGMDGMYLRTGRLYTPVLDRDGQVRAFQEVQPENYLASAEKSVESNCNQIDGIINNEPPKPSVRDSLRQCREEAGSSQGEAAPPSRGPER